MENMIILVHILYDVWFDKKQSKSKSSKTRTAYYEPTDLKKLGKKRRHSRMDRLSSSVRSMSISKSQEEEEYESLQESDDEVFKPPKMNKKTLAKKEVKEKANILSEK
jgi:hypothetical protein